MRNKKNIIKILAFCFFLITGFSIGKILSSGVTNSKYLSEETQLTTVESEIKTKKYLLESINEKIYQEQLQIEDLKNQLFEEKSTLNN